MLIDGAEREKVTDKNITASRARKLHKFVKSLVEFLMGILRSILPSNPTGTEDF